MSPTIIVEKEGLLPSTIAYQSKPEAISSLRRIVVISLGFACSLTALSFWRGNLEVTDIWSPTEPVDLAERCPQPLPLEPTKNGELWRDVVDSYGSTEFLNRAVEWLGGAVRVK